MTRVRGRGEERVVNGNWVTGRKLIASGRGDM